MSDKDDRKKARLTGRPILIQDDDLETWKLIEQYAQAGCLGTSIASMLGCCADTLYQAVERKFKMTFSAYLAQKKGEGNDILRMAQFKTAVKGNPTMLIWLGKQWLGQTDKVESLNKNDDKIEINVNFAGDTEVAKP